MSRKVCPVTDRTCTHHGCVVQGEGVCWASGAKHPRPVRTAGEGKALVYTENDVRNAVTTWDGDALATWDHVESFLDHLRASQSELTEELIARSEVLRLLALMNALTSGRGRGLGGVGHLVPDAAWDDLKARGLVASDHDGEWITGQGVEYLRQSIEGQAMVFTVSAALAACENPDGGDEAAADAIAEHRGELSPMIPREQSDRLVALALVWGAWDYGGLDHVWDGLFKDGLIREAGDQTGERWSVLTDKGEAFLRAELERDR